MEYALLLRVGTAETGPSNAVTVWLDGGLGILGSSGGVVEGSEGVALPLRVPASSPGLTVRLQMDGADRLEARLPWPPGLQERQALWP